MKITLYKLVPGKESPDYRKWRLHLSLLSCKNDTKENIAIGKWLLISSFPVNDYEITESEAYIPIDLSLSCKNYYTWYILTPQTIESEGRLSVNSFLAKHREITVSGTWAYICLFYFVRTKILYFNDTKHRSSRTILYKLVLGKESRNYREWSLI